MLLGKKKKTKHQVKYLKGVLSVELTDITAKNVRAPDDGEVLRSHPGPLRVQGHLVQVPHQEVDCPGNGDHCKERIHSHHHCVIYIYIFVSTCYGDSPPPFKGKLNIFPSKERVRKK